jgi:hypothetical protein
MGHFLCRYVKLPEGNYFLAQEIEMFNQQKWRFFFVGLRHEVTSGSLGIDPCNCLATDRLKQQTCKQAVVFFNMDYPLVMSK